MNPEDNGLIDVPGYKGSDRRRASIDRRREFWPPVTYRDRERKRQAFWRLAAVTVLVVVILWGQLNSQKRSCSQANDLRDPLAQINRGNAASLRVRSTVDEGLIKKLDLYRIAELDYQATLLTPLDCSGIPDTQGSTGDNLPKPDPANFGLDPKLIKPTPVLDPRP